MAAFEGSDDEKTESASSYRREEFRKQGTVALSKELMSVVALIAIGASFYFVLGSISKEFNLMAEKFFSYTPRTGFWLGDFGRTEMTDLLTAVLKSFSWMVVPTFAVAMVVGLVVCAAQVGFYITWDPLTPNWDRINPINGFQRLFSGKGAIEGVKALFKLVIVVLVVWSFLSNHMNEAPLFFSKSLNESTALTLALLSKLFFTILFSLSVLSVLDYAYQRWQLEKQMKTTRREAKEEFKLREGDPLIKNRIKAIQRRIASRRMMEAVPKADVVVTNPTHIAVALKYDSLGMHAPKVVAKGAGNVAQKIKEIARFNRIPVVENKPLARTLFKELQINQYIPRELYKAVAEVLAYVYRLRGMQKVANG